jgi:hypothetical protein
MEPIPIAVCRSEEGKISVDQTYTAEKAAPENALPAMFRIKPPLVQIMLR